MRCEVSALSACAELRAISGRPNRLSGRRRQACRAGSYTDRLRPSRADRGRPDIPGVAPVGAKDPPRTAVKAEESSAFGTWFVFLPAFARRWSVPVGAFFFVPCAARSSRRSCCPSLLPSLLPSRRRLLPLVHCIGSAQRVAEPRARLELHFGALHPYSAGHAIRSRDRAADAATFPCFERPIHVTARIAVPKVRGSRLRYPFNAAERPPRRHGGPSMKGSRLGKGESADCRSGCFSRVN